MNICPVCGFLMRYPPRDWHICPSCGTEFGYEDVGRTHEELKNGWIARGMRWWSPVETPPIGWSPIEQLNNLAVLRTQTYTLSLAYSNNATTVGDVSGITWVRRGGRRSHSTLLPMSANAAMALTGVF